MSRHATKLALAVAALAAVVSIDAFLLHGRMSHWAADLSAPAIAPVTVRVSSARAYIGSLVSRTDLAAEHVRLTAEVERLQAQQASTEALQQELEFYRAAAGIAPQLGTDPLSAAIFSYPRAGGVREAVVNKGMRDWVAAGDVVITPGGALVGVVHQAYDEHAVVLTVGDPLLEVTARILGTQISGLVRANADGLVLDLVSRDEAVSEGQVVVTSGNDRFPAGLVLGTVRSVDANQTTLFTVIRLNASSTGPAQGKVIIIRP